MSIHKIPRQLSAINLLSMVSIRVCPKQLSAGRGWAVGESEIHGALEISEEMLDCFPVSHTWVGVESGKLVDSVRDVWSSASAEIHESTHSIDVGNGGHLLLLLGSLRCICIRKSESWIHGSRERVAIEHGEGEKGIDDILALGERKGIKWTISGNFYTQKVRSGPKISKFEVLGQLFNDSLDGGYSATCKSDMYQDGNNDSDIIPGIEVDRKITLEMLETYLEKHRIQLLVSKSASLFETIQALHQSQNIT